MKLALAAIVALLIASSSFSAEAQPPPAKSAVETMDAKAKAERIEKVTKKIARSERFLSEVTPQNIANTRTHNEKAAADKEAERAQVLKALPIFRLELRWLKGEVTLVAAEAAAKKAQEALDKAKVAKQPTEVAEKALTAAQFEVQEVTRLEAEAKPKVPEPEAAAAPRS